MARALRTQQKGKVASSKTMAKALDGGKGIFRQNFEREAHDNARQATSPFRIWWRTHGFERHEFRDLSNIDIVGIYPDYASALQAWKAKAQATVDNAHMRYFIAHLHRLLDPGKDYT